MQFHDRRRRLAFCGAPAWSAPGRTSSTINVPCLFGFGDIRGKCSRDKNSSHPRVGLDRADRDRCKRNRGHGDSACTGVLDHPARICRGDVCRCDHGRTADAIRPKRSAFMDSCGISHRENHNPHAVMVWNPLSRVRCLLVDGPCGRDFTRQNGEDVGICR